MNFIKTKAVVSLVYCILFAFFSCKPKLTDKVVIELSTDRIINQYDSVSGDIYTVADYELDNQKTLSIIENRLRDADLYYGEKQIQRDAVNPYLYTISLPEGVDRKMLTDLLTQSNRLEIWKVFPEDIFYSIVCQYADALEDKLLYSDSALTNYSKGFVAQIKDTAEVIKIMKDAMSPNFIELRWGKLSEEADSTKMKLFALEKKNGRLGPLITSEFVTEVFTEEGPQGDRYCVMMQMSKEGALRWEQITADNMGKNLAIVVDGEVCSMPMVCSIITSGCTNIDGSFNKEEAELLAVSMRYGELPLTVNIIP